MAVVRWALELNDTSPAAAREIVRSVVGYHPRLDDFLVATSELVTNVVRHAPHASFIELVVEDGDAIRVTARQPGHDDFDRAVRDPDEPTGRGLFIVAGVTDSWGIDTATGIEVWFEIAAATARPTFPPDPSLDQADLSDSMNDSFS